MRPGTWVRNCILLLLAGLLACGIMVAWLDPFFHYHTPRSGFSYVLDEQRSQNDGITKHFAYDAIITGTSMTENFRASEAEALFGGTFVKLPYAGATYRELNDNLKVAFATHGDLRIVIRGLDLSMIAVDPAILREDMGTYPDYLYNQNPFDDVKYLWNRDVIFRYCGMMLLKKVRGDMPGVTTFDAYSFTGDNYHYDAPSALEGDMTFSEPEEIVPLTKEDADHARTNMKEHVCAIAAAHPETGFYYFIPPYSMAYWGKEKEFGTLDRTLELQRIMIGELVQYDNIKVYAFGMMTDITADLSNYHDRGHYAPWVNTKMLEYMKADVGRITKENAKEYLDDFEALVKHYDYQSLPEQVVIE